MDKILLQKKLDEIGKNWLEHCKNSGTAFRITEIKSEDEYDDYYYYDDGCDRYDEERDFALLED